MKTNTKRAVIVVVVIGLAGVVSATDRVSEISTAAFIGVPSSDGSEQAIEIWGFEAAEGFSPGFIAGQAGWTAFSSSLVEGHIDTVNPNGGSQHLRISQDPAVAAGTLLGAFSPVATDLVVDASTMTVFVNIGAVGGASYDVVPQAPSQSFLTARVSFAFSGDILVLDDPGTGLTFVDTGVDYTPGTYVALQIDVDPGANTIDYFYNGVLIYSSAGGVFAGTLIEQVVLLSDNFNAGESADFDDLFIDRGAVPVELQSFDIE